jgi:3-oxoacyl-[acyl-carrier protein] reductase
MAPRPDPAAELTLADIAVGDSFSVVRIFEADDVARFAAVSGDFSPLHVDAAYAATTEFGRPVVHGMLLASLFSQLVGMRIPGRHALYLGQDLAFRKPVFVGQTVTASAKVTAVSLPTRTIQLATEIRTDDGLVVSGSAKVKIREGEVPERAPAAAPAKAAGTQPVALVTGASRGIGAAIARRLAASGNAVVINYFSSDQQASVLEREIAAGGGQAFAHKADVRAEADVAAMVAAIEARFGRLDIVVNGASGALTEASAAEVSWSEVTRNLDYHLKAAMLVCQQAFPHLKASGNGRIVNILSQVVTGTPPAGMSAYTAAKYAMLGFSRALAGEWASHAIRVNTISPGLVETDLTSHYAARTLRNEALRTPLKRLATPEDIANTAAFLCSEQSSFITGANLFVTGGQVVQ